MVEAPTVEKNWRTQMAENKVWGAVRYGSSTWLCLFTEAGRIDRKEPGDVSRKGGAT